MIRYALTCADCEGGFEAWYANSAAYDALAKAGQLECAYCRGHRVCKQIMAPAVAGTKKSAPSPALPKKAELIAAAREHIEDTHDYVGERFPDEVRAMHYGETDERPVWGTATAEEARTLNEEGIGATPLPAALTPKPPKDELN
jgi:hypothetical protein